MKHFIKSIKEALKYEEWSHRTGLFSSKVWFEFLRLAVIGFFKISLWLVLVAVWVKISFLMQKTGVFEEADPKGEHIASFVSVAATIWLVFVSYLFVRGWVKLFWKWLSSNWNHARRNAEYRGKTVEWTSGKKEIITDMPSPGKAVVGSSIVTL